MKDQNMRAACIAAITMLLLARPASAMDPSPQTLTLGERYMTATGGIHDTLEQQVYAAAGIMGDTPASHAHQQAWLDATDKHRAEIDALDLKLAALLAQTFNEAELQTAVAFLESPEGRSITQKKHAYFAALFARDRPSLTFTPQEQAALAAYDQLPEAISMRAKMPVLLAQTMQLTQPLLQAIGRSAATIYCHASRRCTPGDSDFDQLSGPTLRERQ